MVRSRSTLFEHNVNKTGVNQAQGVDIITVRGCRFLGVRLGSGVGCLGSALESILPDERVKLRGPPPWAHMNDARIHVARVMPIGTGWDDAPCHAVMTQGVMVV